MAPLPKPPGQRRRRNKAVAPVKLAAKSKVKLPPLPGETLLMPATRAWWRTVWSSPMAAVYLDADVPALTRAAMLVEEISLGDASMQSFAELRQLEDRFGLSPKARRALQWEVEQATGAGKPAAEVEPADDERFERLRAVK